MGYARQITAEEKRVTDKGIETWEAIRDDNHYLDCECIASALADWEWPGGGVNLIPDPVPAEEEEPQKSTINPYTNGSSFWE